MAVHGGRPLRVAGLVGLGFFMTQRRLNAAYDLIADWTAEEREAMRRDVPRARLATPLRSPHIPRHRTRNAGDLAGRPASSGAAQHGGRGRDPFYRPRFSR